jgi:hypothetical protein
MGGRIRRDMRAWNGMCGRLWRSRSCSIAALLVLISSLFNVGGCICPLPGEVQCGTGQLVTLHGSDTYVWVDYLLGIPDPELRAVPDPIRIPRPASIGSGAPPHNNYPAVTRK